MTRLPLLLACAATLSLAAQEASLGVRAHGLLPMGDLRGYTHGQPGLGLAVFVDIPAGRGLLFRPLVGGQLIPTGNSLDLPGTKTRVTTMDLMVDTLWFPGEDPERGPYLIGSAGAQQWRLSATGASPSTVNYGRIALAGGLGYQATPKLAFEAKGFWSPVAPGLTATGLTAGAAYRF